MNIKQAIVFAILMQGGEGIMSKHPSYLGEKLKSCELMENPERLLDTDNLAIFKDYCVRFRIEVSE